ncbi:MAG: DUF4942 domain-containing protein [Bacteroidota bacterium]
MLEPYYQESQHWRRTGLALKSKTILEPSAGKGDVLDYIKNEVADARKPRAMYCIEQNPDLQAILREKNYDVIGDDFLSFESPYTFDLIVMNPPFDAGAKHLLKAWEISQGGDIVCLLNAETYHNPYTKERELLKTIIDEHGTIEELGNCFSTSERKTNVNVILVRLSKQFKKSFEFENDPFDLEDNPYLEFPEDIEGNQVEVLDVLQAYENRYKGAVEAFKNLKLAISKFQYYTKNVFIPDYVMDDYLKLAREHSINPFVRKFNEACWQRILSESKFERFLTTNVRRSFTDKFSHQQKLAFTKANMVTLFQVLWQNKEDILESCIEDVFDIMTYYHHENRMVIEGWKTNDAWRVNRKVILPHIVSYGKYMSAPDLKSYGDKFSLNWKSELEDIDRCMCYIDARAYERTLTVSQTLKQHFDNVGRIRTGETFDKECESTYFKLRFFKKGTVHLTFKDRYLWQEFNYRAAQRKGFPLPERVSKKESDPQSQPETGQTEEGMTLFPALTA